MPSDLPLPSGRRTDASVTRLADLLAEAGAAARPGPRELAELLWLAGQLGGGEGSTEAGAARPPSPVRDEEAPDAPPTPPPAPDPSSAPRPAGPEPSEHGHGHGRADGRVPLHLPARGESGAGTGGHRTLHVPAPPMLARPLTLQRALRPLKRTVPAPTGHVLDEPATAHRIAALGGDPARWLPVLRPAAERWLRLDLVYDTGPTMPVWRPLVRELRDALAQSGIFRTVSVHRAGPDGRVRHSGAPAPADGRTVTLLVSDCTGPQWRPGPAGDLWYAQLRRWAARMPLAVLQPLPERLWRTTALPTTPGLLTATAPAAPNASLSFESYDGDSSPSEDLLPLPVLEPTATWLGHWAELIADPGGRQLPGAVAWLGLQPPVHSSPGTEPPDTLSPSDLILRFRSHASPEAFRLAGHLAVGRPELPVMRLVQAAIEPDPQPQHLAEVVLSGLLRTPPAATPGAYAFRPGVRELLLGTLPRSAQGRTEQLLSDVGELIDARAGLAAPEFTATTTGGDEPAPSDGPIATVSPGTARLLGGAPPPSPLIAARYRLGPALGRNEKYWSAVDERTGERVVVRLADRDLSAWPGSLPEHPNLVRVLEVGEHEGRPFMALEHVDGPKLSSYRTHAQEAQDMAAALIDAVTTLHAAGVVHGRLVAENILVAPDGTPKISGFALHRRPAASRVDDLQALGQILINLAYAQRWDRDVELPQSFRQLLTDLESGIGPAWPTRLPWPYRPLGPMGLTMWRARQEETGEEVVIQHFSGLDADDPVFTRTTDLLTALHHENVVRVLDRGRTDQGAFLVTERVRGVSLRELLAESGASGVPLARFRRLAHQLAVVVRDMHAQSLPHRDLTANHVLVTDDDHLILCGFALARDVDSAVREDLAKVGTHVQAMATGRAPTSDELRADELVSLPEAWRGQLATLVNDLRFGSLDQARAALTALTTLTRKPAPPRPPRLYRLFGPPRYEEGGRVTEVGLPGSLENAVLYALLIRWGELVSYEQLLADIGEQPPGASAEEQLRAALDFLRAELGDDVVGDAADGMLFFRFGEGDTTDVVRVEELTADAIRAREQGRAADSLRLVEEALDLMHGEPLPGVPGVRAAVARDSMAALSVTLRLTRAELHYADGDFEQALDYATDVLRERWGHPEATRLRMSALHSLGRRVEALNTYQAYEDQLDSPTEADPPIRRLQREIAASLGEARLYIEFTETPQDARTRETLNALLHQALRANLSDLGRLTLQRTDDGQELFVVTAAQGALLTRAVRTLGDIHRALPGNPRLRALLDVRPPDLLEALAAEQVQEPLALALSPELYDSLVVRDQLADARLFRPLGSLARYCVWPAPELANRREERTLTLPSAHASRPFTAQVEFNWTFSGPQLPGGQEPEELVATFRDAASRITVLHPPLDSAAALHQLRQELHAPKSPRVTAQHAVLSLTTERPPAGLAPRRPRLDGVNPLTEATTVLVSFDGPLVHLYPGERAAAQACRELLVGVTEQQDVEETLRGEPVVRNLREAGVHPLDVLRTYAGRPLAHSLRSRLDGIELRAVYQASRNQDGTALLSALRRAGRDVAIVSDTSPEAMDAWLGRNGDVSVNGGFHGRTLRLDRLMPDPDCLSRALEALNNPPRTAAMIGSSVAEYEAAQALGLHFVAYARGAKERRQLRDAGCELIVDSLEELQGFTNPQP
ncbi:SAV_2336 N-terminal domain-related protein [Streptomyces cavernicola]|uniref:SAV_2336 N-terminal domain-related protein n=1 Tax=Streptomyces cavernicola TaxID=3043613 RepID=A0ABT6SJD3_9ACTN|nr:SAV_2336 N-terminal domain-related protein [Streptomyces sp. B-S-A6]MDI3408280.1 SAV_2336 N-terminal domain-related protein [Streptomyces sp. B-S-A6]